MIVYSLIVGIAVYYNQREADRKIQTLEIQVISHPQKRFLDFIGIYSRTETFLSLVDTKRALEFGAASRQDYSIGESAQC